MSMSPADFAATLSTTAIEFRQYAEALMTDTCLIEYETGETTRDEASDREIPVWATRLTSKCKVQILDLTSERVKLGEQIVVLGEVRIDIPVSTPQVHQDDRVTITAVGPTSDPRLLGRTFLVGSPMNKTFASATRLTVKETP